MTVSNCAELGRNLRRNIKGQENLVSERLQRSESARPVLDGFHNTIQPFTDRVSQAGFYEGDNAIVVFTHGAHKFLQWIKPASHHPVHPGTQKP